MRHFILLVSALLLPLVSWAQSVRVPIGFKREVPSFVAGQSYVTPECIRPVPHTGEMKFTDKYNNTSGKHELNKDAEARYKEEVKPFLELEQAVGGGVENYWKNGDPAYLNCVMDNLMEWSRKDAMSRPAGNSIGVMVRSWALSSIASAYLKLKLSASKSQLSHYSAADRLKVEKWLMRLASRVMKERPVNAPKINNHHFWAAQAIVTMAAVVQKRDYLNYSADMFEAFSTEVTDLGFMPNELERRTRALSYHNYSLQPLSILAAFLEVNSMMSSNGRDALKRVVVATLAGIKDPRIFEDEARSYAGSNVKPSEDFKQVAIGSSPWIAPYCFAEPSDCHSISLKTTKKSVVEIRMGGDMILLYGSH